jgi:hypothetical protein
MAPMNGSHVWRNPFHPQIYKAALSTQVFVPSTFEAVSSAPQQQTVQIVIGLTECATAFHDVSDGRSQCGLAQRSQQAVRALLSTRTYSHLSCPKVNPSYPQVGIFVWAQQSVMSTDKAVRSTHLFICYMQVSIVSSLTYSKLLLSPIHQQCLP